MCVGPEGETRIGVAEVLAQRQDRLARIKERTRVEVAQRVAAVLALGLNTGSDERRTPDLRVEVVPVEGAGSREKRISSPARSTPSLLFHGSVTLRGG
jgi:hypothetical protein